MLNQPWDVVFLIAFVLYVGIRNWFARRTRDNELALHRVDRLEKILLGFVVVGSLLIPVVYLFTPVLGFAEYRLPSMVPWVGLVVMGLALYLFYRSHADLGLNWSATLEVRSGHTLITEGVYRSIRHPMYSAIWLFGLAQAMLLANWVAGFSALVTFAPLYFVRVPREEQMMVEVFGAEYERYIQRTGRLLPRLRKAD